MKQWARQSIDLPGRGEELEELSEKQDLREFALARQRCTCTILHNFTLYT